MSITCFVIYSVVREHYSVGLMVNRSRGASGSALLRSWPVSIPSQLHGSEQHTIGMV